MLGAVFGIAWMIIKRQNQSVPMPFGPWLASAGFIALIWHDEILAYMTQMFMPF
jgi:leader peptidase (prepilin peptidase)/N-methyltransferase